MSVNITVASTLGHGRLGNPSEEQLDLIDEFWRKEDLQVIGAAHLRCLGTRDKVWNLDRDLTLVVRAASTSARKLAPQAARRSDQSRQMPG